jgi:hypothetical protein
MFVQLECDGFMVEESGGRWSLQQVAPRRGTTLVTMAQVSTAYFGLLSHVVDVGGVLCRARLFLFRGFVRVVVYASEHYVPNAISSYMIQ